MGITQKIFSLLQSSKIIVLGVLFGCSVLIWGMVPQIVLADEAGYALEFDGTNDYVALGDTGDLMISPTWISEKTISLWIKPTGVNAPMTAPTSGAMILGVDRPRLFGITRAVYQDQDQIYVWNADSDGIDIVGVPFVLGEWLQVTMVHSGGLLSVYKNGELVGSTPSGDTNVPGGSIDGNLYLGGSGRSDTALYFEGQIDEVRLWGQALESSVIQSWVTTGITSLHPYWVDLSAYYTMNVGAGTTLTDDSTNAHTGTLLGGMSDINWLLSEALTLPGQPTNTPQMPTNSPTSTVMATFTNTPLPPSDTPTPTDTATDIPLPPSDTPTSTGTSTPTETSVPPTATFTPTSSDTPTPTDTTMPTNTPFPSSSPPNLVEIGYADTPGDAYTLEVFNDVAYVADKNRSFQLYDVSDPTNPSGLGSFTTTGGAYGEAISGNLAYVTDTLFGLHILDVTDPAHPIFVSSIETPGFSWEATVSGDFVFISDRWNGLTILNVADPANLFQASNLPLADQVLDTEVAASGNYAYTANYSAGLRVVDVSDENNPFEVGAFDTPGRAYGLFLDGSTIYLADGGSGLWIIDVSDPTNPTLLGGYNTVGWARSVVVSGDYAFIADWTGGITVLDVSDPANPNLIQSFETPGSTRDIFTVGDKVYTADYEGGLRIYDMYAP